MEVPQAQRRASMPAMTRRNYSSQDSEESFDLTNYDTEIKNLQETLKDLGIGKPTSGECSRNVRHKIHSPPDTFGKVSGRQSRSKTPKCVTDEFSEDYVPHHLVSPYLKHKANGFLRVKDDIEDTGVVSPRSAMYRRRKSDPGYLSPHLLRNLQARSAGISSDSSEDDEMMEVRSPRARSPRRIFTSVPEDETFPASPPQMTEMGSPRRRIHHPRHAQTLNPADESPNRRRRNRSNSLPLPDKALLGFGEASALFNPNGNEMALMRQYMPKRSRCISIEESPLEDVLDECANQRGGRRYSVPAIMVRPPLPELVVTKEPET